MKWIIILINVLLLLEFTWALAKQEKIIKKPFSLKPTKKTKSIIDEFSSLSSDDVEFIKQLDKQFKIHGDKIKIKVERDNTTGTKNSKRTIDGSLGYGYHQDEHNNFYFTQPKYMDYQYSQHDIPAQSDSHQREVAHSIEIQPSHGYEIKDDVNVGYHNQNEQYDAVPVIVLRIPGPTKYALHLQALLQQYLELRASHLLKLLEEQDGQGLLNHPPANYVQQQHARPVAYLPMVTVPVQQSYNYYHQGGHKNQYYPTRHYHARSQEEDYYNQALRYQQNLQYQQQLAYQQYHQQQQESDYVSHEYDEPRVYVTNPPEAELREGDTELETSENFPSEKHTQVIFKKKHKPTAHPGYDYSKPTAVVHGSYHHNSDEARPEEFYDLEHKEYNSDATTLSVTQRVRSPYNHHARPSVPTHSPVVSVAPRNLKRDAPYTEEQFNKAKQVVRKLKRSRGSQRKIKRPQQKQQQTTLAGKSQENQSQ